MKFLTAFLLTLTFAFAAFAQSEQAPITRKDFGYKDWTYKNLEGDGETNLRKFSQGKKLVMVVHWAPWCPNWRHDVAFVRELHEKYGDQGLSIIGVGEYDSVAKMKSHAESYKLKFPLVYAGTLPADREKSQHFTQRRAIGDMRKWGTPWYVFLEPGSLTKEGEVLANSVDQVSGELIKDNAEKFIRTKLGIETASEAISAQAVKPD
ncbi:hypothetical protein BH24ACI3_BH24ACI3_04900 [soil metagenome]